VGESGANRRVRAPRPALADTLLYAGALGLAMFSITGARIAEHPGLRAVAGIVLSTISGAAGGAARNVFSARLRSSWGAAISSRARRFSAPAPTLR
jgi:uncharacterized membrane protein YeiH